MANSYYNHGTTPITLSASSSALIRAELDAVTAGFDKFPTLAANGNKVLVINGAGTAITVTTGQLILGGNLTTTGAFNTTFVQQANVTITLPAVSGLLATGDEMNQGGLWGLTLSNNTTDPTNDLDIQPGGAASGDATIGNVTYMQLNAVMTKQLDATWAAGTGAGGRTSSKAINNETWHVFLMIVSGAVDVGFDNDPQGDNLIADHGATKVRRIGSIPREGGAFLPFLQRYDFFWRDVPINIFSTNNPGTAAVTTVHLKTPENLVTEAIVNFYYNDTTPTVTKYALLSSMDMTDTAPTETVSTMSVDPAATVCSSMHYVKTNTLGQIRYRLNASDADVTVKLMTHGWIDQRGRHQAD